MTQAQKIVERLLARRPLLSEGLESHVTDYLSTLGYRPGEDFYFENGAMVVADPAKVDEFVVALNDSGQFGPATAQGPAITFGPFSDEQAKFDAVHGDGTRRERPPSPGPEADPSLVMCDNCGSQTHHTDECPYSFGANPQ